MRYSQDMSSAKVTVSLYLTPSERDELMAFSERNRHHRRLGRLYADGVLAKIREVERDSALIAAGRTQIDPSLMREAAQ